MRGGGREGIKQYAYATLSACNEEAMKMQYSRLCLTSDTAGVSPQCYSSCQRMTQLHT